MKRSKVNFESALKIFQEINHIVGQALCHGQLAFISKTLKNKVIKHCHKISYRLILMITLNSTKD